MHAGVGAAGAVKGDRGPFERRERILDQSLNRNALSLRLPADEVGAVVLDRELQRPQLVLEPGLTIASPFAQCGQFSGA